MRSSFATSAELGELFGRTESLLREHGTLYCDSAVLGTYPEDNQKIYSGLGPRYGARVHADELLLVAPDIHEALKILDAEQGIVTNFMPAAHVLDRHTDAQKLGFFEQTCFFEVERNPESGIESLIYAVTDREAEGRFAGEWAYSYADPEHLIDAHGQERPEDWMLASESEALLRVIIAMGQLPMLGATERMAKHKIW